METILVELTPIIGVALEVIAGKYGNGADRIKALEKEGYDYDVIQGCVNELMKIKERYS